MKKEIIYIVVAPCDVDRSAFLAHFNNKKYESAHSVYKSIDEFINDLPEDVCVIYDDFQILSIDYFLDDLNTDCLAMDNSWVAKIIVEVKDNDAKIVELSKDNDNEPDVVPVGLIGGRLVVAKKSNIKGEYELEVMRPVSRELLKQYRDREHSKEYCLAEWKDAVANDKTTQSLYEFVRDMEDVWDMHNNTEAYMGKVTNNVFADYKELRNIADEYVMTTPSMMFVAATWEYEHGGVIVKSDDDIIFNKDIYDTIGVQMTF